MGFLLHTRVYVVRYEAQKVERRLNSLLEGGIVDIRQSLSPLRKMEIRNRVFDLNMSQDSHDLMRFSMFQLGLFSIPEAEIAVL